MRREKKQADKFGIQCGEIRQKVQQNTDTSRGYNSVCWKSDKSDSPQASWSTASLGHLSELTWNSRWPLHSTVCSSTQQDQTWQVKSLWAVLALLMASWFCHAWVFQTRGESEIHVKMWKNMQRMHWNHSFFLFCCFLDYNRDVLCFKNRW